MPCTLFRRQNNIKRIIEVNEGETTEKRAVLSKTIFVHRPICELCGSEANEILLSKKMTDPAVWDFLEEYYEGRADETILEGGDYEIAKCQECGFVWQAYVFNEDIMQMLYGNWISAEQSLKKKKFGGISLFSKYANEVAAISLLITKAPYQINVLDFGMGWGYWANMAKAFGYNVVGLEVSQERLQYARNMGVHVVDSIDAIGDQKFDFINSEQVFEHITEPLETLKRLSEALIDGGVIRISVPDGKQTLASLKKPDWRARKDALHPLEHINCFTHSTLIRLGQGAGLSFIERPFPIMVESRKETVFNLLTALIGRHKSRGTTLYFRREG